MAKVGNEAILILRLAEEKMNNDLSVLNQEIRYIEAPGNQTCSCRTDWKEALKKGYTLGVRQYKDTLSNVVRGIENR